MTDRKRRFVCECGERSFDGGWAVEHTFMGHETGVEMYRNGGWVWDNRTTVESLILERVPDPQAFVRSVQEKADALEAEAMAEMRN